MDDSNFNKRVTLIRIIIGALLTITSVTFLWKGVTSSGEIGIDFQFFSGKFSTTSAGFALLVAGIILLLPQRLPHDTRIAAQRSLGQMVVGILFYIFIGLLPVFAYVAIMIYINYYGSTVTKSAFPMYSFYIIMIEVGLFSWVVKQVSQLLKNGEKK